MCRIDFIRLNADTKTEDTKWIDSIFSVRYLLVFLSMHGKIMCVELDAVDKKHTHRVSNTVHKSKEEKTTVKPFEHEKVIIM